MHITLKTSLKYLAISLVLIFAGIIATIIVMEIIRYSTRDELKMLNPMATVTDAGNLPEMPLKKIEKSKTTFTPTAGSLEGFFPPIRTDTPIPSESKKANNSIDNLLFAMSYYYHVPSEKEMNESVIVWDPQSGYYLPDTAFPETALARNVRYLLCLTIYQRLYPTTKYFDDETIRMKALLEKQLADQHLDTLLSTSSILQQRIPAYLFHDLLELANITGDPLYRKAFIKVGEKLSGYAKAQAALIRNNRDRSDKITMFGDAAMAYIYGQETGKIDFFGDAQLLMDELMEQLWAKKFNLFYTDATIGQYGNITETFITSEQMDALINITRFAQASGDEELPEIVHQVLKSMADGVNPIVDTQRLGFFRRYNGKSQTPHTDFKLAEDHIKYLEAWIRLNMLKKGEYELVLNGEFDGYEMFLYDDTNNAIYMSYETNWQPRPESQGKPLVSVDAILAFVLITLQDRRFSAEKATGS